MAIRFVGIDPDTDGGDCPSVSVDTETGDFLINGWTETGIGSIEAVTAHSPIGANETLVRVPARMASVLAEAVRDSTTTR